MNKILDPVEDMSSLQFPHCDYFRLYQLVLKHDYSEIRDRLLELHPRHKYERIGETPEDSTRKDAEYLEAFGYTYDELSKLSYNIKDNPLFVLPEFLPEAPKDVKVNYEAKDQYKDLMRICIKYVDKDDMPVKGHEDDFEPWYCVEGKNGELFGSDSSIPDEVKYQKGKDDPWLKEEITWGLEFSSWIKWLTWRIDPETMKNYSEIDILCHCLWEMTFFGFSEDKVKEQSDEINRRADDVDKAIAMGDMSKFKSAEEVFADLKEKFGWEKDSDETDESESNE